MKESKYDDKGKEWFSAQSSDSDLGSISPCLLPGKLCYTKGLNDRKRKNNKSSLLV